MQKLIDDCKFEKNNKTIIQSTSYCNEQQFHQKYKTKSQKNSINA